MTIQVANLSQVQGTAQDLETECLILYNTICNWSGNGLQDTSSSLNIASRDQTIHSNAFVSKLTRQYDDDHL